MAALVVLFDVEIEPKWLCVHERLPTLFLQDGLRTMMLSLFSRVLSGGCWLS